MKASKVLSSSALRIHELREELREELARKEKEEKEKEYSNQDARTPSNDEQIILMPPLVSIRIGFLRS